MLRRPLEWTKFCWSILEELRARSVNIHEANTHLSRLVEAAAGGEAFIIARAGRPLVKVVPLDAGERRAPRRLGFLAGRVTVPDDFDAMGEAEVVALFGAP